MTIYYCFWGTARIKTLNSMNITNYADDNKSYATANDRDSLMVSVEVASKSLFTCFDTNLMKSNTVKCHILVSSNEKLNIKIGSHEIANTKREKLSGNVR